MADYAALSNVSPGLEIFGIPIIPATQGATNSDFPSLPKLPDLPKPSTGIPAPGDIINKVGDTLNPFVKGSITSGVFDFLGFPFERLVIVAVGVLFIFGGLYILGTSQIADAFKGVLK